ncbi:hypothetical protein AHAS_Ahas20G0035400 [Arachis hypogaea]
MPLPFDMISKMHPPREAWRLKVRVLRLWVVPSLCEKIKATVKKPLLNMFRDHIVEGQIYKMAYFTVVSNHGSYRATSHEFKLVFLHRTTVVAVDEDVIPKTCFSMFPFSELLNMTQDYDFLVVVIGLLTSVGEEKEYAKEEKNVKMIVLELTSKDLTVRCALFGDYVNQVNYFLASGYVEQPVVVIQLAKVKFFRGQVGLQNVMYTTRMLFNPDLPEVVEFRQSMIEQCVNGIVEDGGWWYSTCVCGKGIYPKNGAYYCDFCLKHITNVTPRFKIKIILEDHSGEGIFLLFDREASYLLKKSCADLFIEVQRDASIIYGDTYPPIFQGLIGKKLLLKVDTKGVTHDAFYGTFQVRRICDDHTIIAIWKDEKTPSNDTVSDDLSAELDILLSSPEKETQEVLSHVLDAPSQYGVKLIHENHVVTSKGKRNLNPQFEEAATDADGRGSKIAKMSQNSVRAREYRRNSLKRKRIQSHHRNVREVLDSSIPALSLNDYLENLVEVSQNINQSSNLILSGCLDVGNPNYECSICGAMFAFTSLGGKVLDSVNDGRGPPQFIITGQNYHRIGSLLPDAGQKPKFAQQTSEIDKKLITELMQMIDTHNFIAQSFRRVKEFYQCHPSEIFCLKLYSQRKVDRRIYSAPSCDEVAALIVGDFDSSDHSRDIIVRFTGVPLLFPYGEDRYQLNIAYRGEQPEYVPGRRTRVSLREFICFRLQIREHEDGIIHKCRRLFQQFVVDCFTMIESQMLYEIRMKQSIIRGEVL